MAEECRSYGEGGTRGGHYAGTEVHEFSGFMTPMAIQDQEPRLLCVCKGEKHLLEPLDGYRICCLAIVC